MATFFQHSNFLYSYNCSMLITSSFNGSFTCKSPVHKWKNRWVFFKYLIIFYISWDSISLVWHLLLTHQTRLIHTNVLEKNHISFEYKHFRLTNKDLHLSGKPCVVKSNMDKLVLSRLLFSFADSWQFGRSDKIPLNFLKYTLFFQLWNNVMINEKEVEGYKLHTLETHENL